MDMIFYFSAKGLTFGMHNKRKLLTNWKSLIEYNSLHRAYKFVVSRSRIKVANMFSTRNFSLVNTWFEVRIKKKINSIWQLVHVKE